MTTPPPQNIDFWDLPIPLPKTSDLGNVYISIFFLKNCALLGRILFWDKTAPVFYEFKLNVDTVTEDYTMTDLIFGKSGKNNK